MTQSQKRLWIGLIILAFLSPLGIILPEMFKAGDAWGEWSTETLQKVLGYVPEGLRKYSDIWKAPMPDYSFGGRRCHFGTQIHILHTFRSIGYTHSRAHHLSNFKIAGKT